MNHKHLNHLKKKNSDILVSDSHMYMHRNMKSCKEGKELRKHTTALVRCILDVSSILLKINRGIIVATPSTTTEAATSSSSTPAPSPIAIPTSILVIIWYKTICWKRKDSQPQIPFYYFVNTQDIIHRLHPTIKKFYKMFIPLALPLPLPPRPRTRPLGEASGEIK